MAGRRRRRDEREDIWRGKTWRLIYGHYKEALDALPLEHIPALAPRLLDAGVCFGFADPVTNIIANTVCLVPDEDGEPVPMCAKKRKRKRKKTTEIKALTREEVLSKIADDEVRTIADRSLRGLRVFLTSYFRHLPTTDAMRYLYLAQGDLLVAVRLIELDRCYRLKDQFCICSHATKTALRCAALSARMPMVDSFLSSSFGLVPHLKLVIKTVAAEPRRCLSVQDVHYLYGLLKEPLMLKKSDNPMNLAAIRIPQHNADASIEKVLGGLIASLRGVLLDRIHDLYLKAVSQLPTEDFRTCHHRGLLKAGYCYGPFNPISNIIVNTIWYDTTFPASQVLEVDMICTMRHVESRSLIGLLAFLRESIPEVSEHEAMIYLLKNDLEVCKAIQMAANQRHYTSGSDESSYKAAADASSHPKPVEYLEFVVRSLPTVLSDVRSLMQASQMISSCDIIRLSRLMSPSSAEPVESPLKLTQDAVDMLSKHKKYFLTEQSITRGKVEAALQNYEETTGCCYELRIICDVNNCVGKQRKPGDPKQQYSHVNFWASTKNGGSPTLFFGQFNNDEGCENQSICCPVSDQSTCDVRCCYCEYQGIRIVHPIQSCWEGGSEFEKVFCGEHQITNAEIVSQGKMIDNEVIGIFRQDYLYLDPLWDCELIPHINSIAWQSTRTWEELERDVIEYQRHNKLNEDHDRVSLQT